MLRSPKVEMNGAVLELTGLCPEWLSLEEHSNCVHKTKSVAAP